MIRRLSTFAVAIAALGAGVNVLCQAESLPPLTRHVRDVVLHGQAQRVGRLAATQPMRLVLVLPLRNEAALDNFLQELYDPSSASYRKFLTVEQFTAMYGPTQEDYDAVIRFAEANGFTVVGTSRNRLNLDVTASVGSIEQGFHLTMGIYKHPTENRNFYAPDREPTPDVAIRLWHISGLDNYSIPQPALHRRDASVKPSATTGSGPSNSFLGSDMRAAYYGGALTGAGQSLGLLEFYGTDLDDLNTYFSNVGQTNNVPITLLSTDGTSTSCLAANGCDDTEQTLDMTQALGMAPGLSSLVMYVGSSDMAIFNAMATANPLNAQLSSSWTWYPPDPSLDDPYFKEFAAQGQNLFQASGDNGAWKSRSQIYPADDVYVTSVGGTSLQTSSAGGPWSSETAWVYGGGGISPDKFPIPSWQTSTASGCASCSTTYRNGPDVSANADFTFYVCAKQSPCTANYYGGTSFAAPMWAGYLALVNEQAVANGKPALGFINPSLYTIGLGANYDTNFHDITSGSNGYAATTGYDLATGWGSPNGSGLVNALAGSPAPPPPPAPTLASATAVSSTEIDLAWSNPSGSNATGNRVLRCRGSGCTPASIIATLAATATTYNDTSVSPNTTYGFAIEAFNAGGTTNSNTLYATTPKPPPPAAPTNVHTTNVLSNEIDLAWTNNAASAAGIRVLRCSGSSSCAPTTVIASLPATATSYKDTGLTASTTYRYVIEAYDNYGQVGDSSPLTATTPAAPPPPASPVLTVGSPTRTSLTLTWTEASSPAVTSFDVLRCTGSGCTPTTVIASGLSGSARSYTNSGLSRRTTYTYKVRANNGGGSRLSNPASGRTN